MEWFNEICFFIIIVQAFIFTDYVLDVNARYAMGFSIIATVIFNIGFNFMVVFRDMWQDIKYK